MYHFKAAKWLQHTILFSIEGILKLLNHFDKNLFVLGKALLEHDLILRYDEFVNLYEHKLQNALYKKPCKDLPVIFFGDKKDVFTIPVNNKILLKRKNPAIQIEEGSFVFSTDTKNILVNVLSQKAMFWGLKISYPQIFFNENDQIIRLKDESFPNKNIFLKLRRYIREHSDIAFFKYKNEKIKSTLRICKYWQHDTNLLLKDISYDRIVEKSIH